jgi:hypothetical protein
MSKLHSEYANDKVTFGRYKEAQGRAYELFEVVHRQGF